jgi:hypothetical protein
MTQYSRPVTPDKVDGSWVNQDGNNTNLYASISLASEDDSEYIKDPDNYGSPDVSEFNLGAVTDPGGAASSWASLPVLKMRTKEEGGMGGTTETATTLFQDSTTIRSFTTHYPGSKGTFTIGTLTDTEADNITATNGDFDNLYLRITAVDGMGGGASTLVYRAWIEFPDAAAPAAAAQNGSAFMLFLDT